MIKNSTINKTFAYKNERERLLNYYTTSPFVGRPEAKTMYKAFKKQGINIVQVSICGFNVGIVGYKQDSNKIRHLLFEMFKLPVKQKECAFTGLIDPYVNRYIKP